MGRGVGLLDAIRRPPSYRTAIGFPGEPVAPTIGSGANT